MKKLIAIIALVALALMPLMAQGGSDSGSLRFGTGGDQGTYYGFGNVIAQRISSETDTSVVAVVSAGSQDNIEMMDMGSYDALQDGKIDAAFVVAGAPTVAVSTLATTHQVYLVSIDQEHLDTLLSSSPYYSPYTIKADVYGTPEDCQTVAVGAVVIARDDVSEDAVYDVVSTIFNDKDAIAQSHDKGRELDLAFATSITTVPYHPGSAKYFAEQGIEVPTK